MVLYYLTIVSIFVIIFRLYLRTKVKICESNVSMTNKVVIVTGANTGIGFEIAKGLAARNARVILACRNDEKAKKARDEIIRGTGNKNVLFKHLDFASLASVREFSEDINMNEERLDVLVNNAGVFDLGNRHTADGIVEEVQVNVFGPFLLTLLLLPLLKRSQPSRIVNLSSLLHYLGAFDPYNINKERYYSASSTYENSKYCNILFTVELARRLKGTGVVVNAVHPGVMYTNMVKGKKLIGIIFMKIFSWLCYRTLYEGAQTPLYLSVAKECETVSGKFFVDCKKWKMRCGVNKEETGAIFWEYSTGLTKYSGDDINRN